MKTRHIFVLSLAVLFSCTEKKTEIKPIEPLLFSVTGKVQKGPFITGTGLFIHDLNEALVQTGKSYFATIQSNDGSWNMNKIELSTGKALLSADGFYYSELYNKLSPAKLTLQALVDFSKKRNN